jgi:hypothetical protein
MKKVLLILSYTIYIFIIIGLYLHTSSHPQIFHKYTFSYLLLLFCLTAGFPFFIFLIIYISNNSNVILKNKKLILRPFHKILLLFVIICLVIILPNELLLREKYKYFESNSYQYTLEDFHPFLQA